MFPANVYVIRLAGDADEDALRALAEMDSAAPLEHPILLGEIDGRPAAAIDLDTHRTVADPFKPTGGIARLVAMRAEQLRAA